MDSLSLTTAATSGHVDTGSKSLHVCHPIGDDSAEMRRETVVAETSPHY